VSPVVDTMPWQFGHSNLFGKGNKNESGKRGIGGEEEGRRSGQ
jgi:hypothetical protein